MTIYERIKDLAKQRRISIRELEMTLHFSNGTLSKWKYDAPEAKLQLVAEFFGVSTAYLRGDSTATRVMAALKKTMSTKHAGGIYLERNHESELSSKSAREINDGFGKVIESEHVIPPFMAIVPDDIVTFPIVGTIKAGPNGIAFQDYQGTQSTAKSGLNEAGNYFYLRVAGDSMTGDGIFDGDLALIERTDVVEEDGAIYAVIYDGENGTLKHVTKTDTAIVLSPSNPAHKPIIIPAAECNDFWVVGRLKQLTKLF
ncbi:LexA family transcriptional regulator [Lacticaseibacillus absianus]|uniref:LexA family transcriptional regulator n=1 Tax=Lacticaseibacillus absianus TaxID=2729623 RepID=UPI0015C99725|nr:XRE family transcriptional regulator [Lacticaseibacillus absianus]